MSDRIDLEALRAEIFKAIYGCPERIDEMEIRSERVCAQLATRITEIVDRHLRSERD